MSKRPPEEPASRKVGYPIGVVGHLSACLLPLGLLFRSLGSPLVIQVPLLRSLGSRLVASAPRRCELAPPKVPQRPVQGPKCTILCSKTNDFAKPPVFQKCSLRAPLGPPRLPQGPPRAPQGRPRAPQGVLQEPLRGAQAPPKSPPRPPKGTQDPSGKALDPPKGPPRGPGAPPSTQGNKRQPNKPPKRIQSRSFRAASDGTRLEHEKEKSRQH